jgi:hypothetical protein
MTALDWDHIPLKCGMPVHSPVRNDYKEVRKYEDIDMGTDNLYGCIGGEVWLYLDDTSFTILGYYHPVLSIEGGLITMKIECHYAGAKPGDAKNLRLMTVDEARRLSPGQHVLVLSHHGKWARARVNGAVKTWKRDTAHVRVSLIYGLKEYWREEFTKDKPTTLLVVEED